MDTCEPVEVSGLGLLQMLTKRPPLNGLNNLLFSKGPFAREVIEITGDPGSGKTYILTDFMAKSLLPTKSNDSDIGGLECGVILFNLDHHFNVFTLVRMMEVRIRRRLKGIEENEVDSIIRTALRRLAIFNVHSNEEFDGALLAANHHLLLNSNISLVILDSVAAFYWENVAVAGIQKMDTYASNIIKMVKRSFAHSNITLMYSRPSYFFSKGNIPAELSTTYDLNDTNTRIKLKQHSRSDQIVRVAEVHACRTVSVVFYDLNENGIDWRQ